MTVQNWISHGQLYMHCTGNFKRSSFFSGQNPSNLFYQSTVALYRINMTQTNFYTRAGSLFPMTSREQFTWNQSVFYASNFSPFLEQQQKLNIFSLRSKSNCSRDLLALRCTFPTILIKSLWPKRKCIIHQLFQEEYLLTSKLLL